jgi:L-asparaginase
MGADLFFTKSTTSEIIVHKNLDTNVAIIKMFPGISEAVLEAILNIPNLKGIVLETYAGNAPTEDWFLNLLRKAISTGLHRTHNALAEVSIWDNMRPVQA